MINQETGTARFAPDKLDRMLFFQVDSLAPGKITPPLMTSTADGKNAYRIILLRSRSLPHKANLKDDYQKIQEVALSEKQNKTLSDWIAKKKKTTYIRINDDMGGCKSLDHWRTAD